VRYIVDLVVINLDIFQLDQEAYKIGIQFHEAAKRDKNQFETELDFLPHFLWPKIRRFVFFAINRRVYGNY
jgi:hypothetical protein